MKLEERAMAAEDPRATTQQWPSPWPYDFPVDGEVPTSEDKLERLAEKDRPPPVKEPPEPLLPAEAVKAIGFWVVVGIVLFFVVRAIQPTDEVGPGQVFETAAPDTFAPGSVNTSWQASNGVVIANADGRIIAVPAGSADPKRAPERYGISVNPITGNVVVDKTVTCQVAKGTCDGAEFYVK